MDFPDPDEDHYVCFMNKPAFLEYAVRALSMTPPAALGAWWEMLGDAQWPKKCYEDGRITVGIVVARPEGLH
jgi:hypothetical protein